MNPLLTLVFVVGTALALGRGLDLGFWTDLESGLCIAGSVWLRYAALGIAVLVSLFLVVLLRLLAAHYEWNLPRVELP